MVRWWRQCSLSCSTTNHKGWRPGFSGLPVKGGRVVDAPQPKAADGYGRVSGAAGLGSMPWATAWSRRVG